MSNLEQLDGEQYLPLSHGEEQAACGGFVGTVFDKCLVGGKRQDDYWDDEIAAI
jgi:hypothetical protein